MEFKSRKLSYLALLAALSVILRFFSFMILSGTIRVSFIDVPIIMAGILFGPLAGAMTGVVSDFLGVLLRNQGGFFPGFTLSAALTGFIPGLFFMKKDLDENIVPLLIITMVVTDFITSIVLNTLWLSIIIPAQGFAVLLPPRLFARAMVVPMQMFLIYFLIRSLAGALNIERIQQNA